MKTYKLHNSYGIAFTASGVAQPTRELYDRLIKLLRVVVTRHPYTGDIGEEAARIIAALTPEVES
ncbi:MAG: hypothetical protein GY841_10310 [FCB group bacterium]|nr:hypothetical protein [FCB group bacterium]